MPARGTPTPGRGSSRSRSTPPAPAARGRTPTPCPHRLADLAGRRGRAGRVRPAAGARRHPRRGRGPSRGRYRRQADRRPGPRRRAAAPAADAAARALDRGPLSRAAGAGHPVDAAAGAARATRARGRADTDAAADQVATVDDAVDVDLLEQLSTGARPARELAAPDGRAGLLRRLRALADAGLIALDWTLLGASGRAALRTLAARDHARVARPRASLAEGEPAGRPPARATTGRRARGAGSGARRRWPARRSRAGTALRRSPGSCDVVWSRPRRGSDRADRSRRGRRVCGAVDRPPRTSHPSRQRPWRGRTMRSGPVTSRPLLLDGVTGGGKTAIYVEAIAASLEAGRPALVLVPEISMAMPLVDRLRADLDARVALVHSGLGDGERADEWRRIRAGDVDIVVGTRLAVVAPLADVGVVIVDEEHDPAYKSDRTPRLQARDAAIRLGELCRRGGRARFGDAGGREPRPRARRSLRPGRPADPADGRAAASSRSPTCAPSWRRAIAACCPARSTTRWPRSTRRGGDQAILVLNRRGTASVVLCRDCGHVQACPDCERPLVYHQAGTTLRCHHCGRATPLATRCPNCHSPRIRYLGGGTERVEREVREAHPRPARRAARSGRRRPARRRGAGDRRVHGGRGRRPRRHEPRRKGARRAERHAGRDRVVRRRAEPARRARRGTDLSAAPPGGRASRAR